MLSDNNRYLTSLTRKPFSLTVTEGNPHVLDDNMSLQIAKSWWQLSAVFLLCPTLSFAAWRNYCITFLIGSSTFQTSLCDAASIPSNTSNYLQI